MHIIFIIGIYTIIIKFCLIYITISHLDIRVHKPIKTAAIYIQLVHLAQLFLSYIIYVNCICLALLFFSLNQPEKVQRSHTHVAYYAAVSFNFYANNYNNYHQHIIIIIIIFFLSMHWKARLVPIHCISRS